MNFIEQLQAAARAVASIELPECKFQPNPAGVVKPGGASELVLKTLREHPGTLSEGQIRFRTGLNHAKTSWALLYLKRIEKIEALPATHRNSRYKRYQIKQGGISDE